MEYAKIENGAVALVADYPDTWNPNAPGILAKGYDFRPVVRFAAEYDPLTETTSGQTVTVEADQVVIEPIVVPRTISEVVRLHATAIVDCFTNLGLEVPVDFQSAATAMETILADAITESNTGLALAVTASAMKVTNFRTALYEAGGTWNDVLLVAQGG